MNGIDLIQKERRRQIEVEHFDQAHDEMHEDGALGDAGLCYRRASGPEEKLNTTLWPWEGRWWKPKSRVRNLIRAGALFQAQADLHRRNGMELDALDWENKVARVAKDINWHLHTNRYEESDIT